MPSIFELDEFKPYQAQFQTQADTAGTINSWITGRIYEDMRVLVSAEYDASVKALYHPLGRATNLHAQMLPGFPAYAFSRATQRSDGIVLPDVSPEDIAASRKLLRWSRWEEHGPLYLRNHALYGRGILCVVDRSHIDPNRPVAFDVRDPSNTLLVYPDKWSLYPRLMITIEERTILVGKETVTAEYATVVTNDSVRIFFDGEPYNDAGNEEAGILPTEAEGPNTFGLVPAVQSTYKNVGNLNAGDTEAFTNVWSDVLPVIQTVNRMSTFIMAVMAQYLKPQLFISGAERGEDDLEWGEGAIYGPESSDAKMLLAAMDIRGATAFVDKVYGEVKSNLPELIFDSIRGINRISTEGLELQFAEVIAKLEESRDNSDAPLNEAFKLGVWAASNAGAPGFEGDRPEPNTPEWEEWELQLDPLRGYVPLGESALIAIDKQRVDLEYRKQELENLKQLGENMIAGMENTISRAGSSAPPEVAGGIKSDPREPDAGAAPQNVTGAQNTQTPRSAGRSIR